MSPYRSGSLFRPSVCRSIPPCHHAPPCGLIVQPPAIRHPARLPCPSRFAPSVVSLCNALSRTTQDHCSNCLRPTFWVLGHTSQRSKTTRVYTTREVIFPPSELLSCGLPLLQGSLLCFSLEEPATEPGSHGGQSTRYVHGNHTRD
jgi:hypothetical protein